MKKNYLIYKVTNKINGKIYIGKTYNFEKRKREHFYDIDNDTPFHRALKKYGKKNFEWEIIDTADTEKEILDKEIFWIKKLNTCIHFPNSNGYNITLGGEGGRSWNSRPVVQFDLNGKYVNEFISSAHASAETGIDRHGISECAAGCRNNAGEFQWKYKDEWKGGAIGKFQKTPSPKCRKIIQLDTDGYIINIFNSVTEAAKQLGVRRSGISSCLIGRTAVCGGFQWIYEEEYSPLKDYKYKGIKEGNGIVQLDDNWNIVNRFRNCSEAARYLGEDEKLHKLIHKRLSENKKCRGFYWRKFDDYLKRAI